LSGYGAALGSGEVLSGEQSVSSGYGTEQTHQSSRAYTYTKQFHFQYSLVISFLLDCIPAHCYHKLVF
jgi:hypothetical protein